MKLIHDSTIQFIGIRRGVERKRVCGLQQPIITLPA